MGGNALVSVFRPSGTKGKGIKPLIVIIRSDEASKHRHMRFESSGTAYVKPAVEIITNVPDHSILAANLTSLPSSSICLRHRQYRTAGNSTPKSRGSKQMKTTELPIKLQSLYGCVPILSTYRGHAMCRHFRHPFPKPMVFQRRY